MHNHDFILTDKGWGLSPAYDINPSIEKDGLALNIDMDDNALDFEVAKSAGEYFRLNDEQMDTIIHKVLEVIGQWQTLAAEIGISRSEQVLITGAFMDG